MQALLTSGAWPSIPWCAWEPCSLWGYASTIRSTLPMPSPTQAGLAENGPPKRSLPLALPSLTEAPRHFWYVKNFAHMINLIEYFLPWHPGSGVPRLLDCLRLRRPIQDLFPLCRLRTIPWSRLSPGGPEPVRGHHQQGDYIVLSLFGNACFLISYLPNSNSPKMFYQIACCFNRNRDTTNTTRCDGGVVSYNYRTYSNILLY